MNLPFYEDIKDWPLSRYLDSIEKKNLKYKTWKIKQPWDQGTNNSCVGYACNMLLECDPKPVKTAPDPEKIFAEARLIDNSPNKTGVSIKSGLKALQKMGYVKSYYYADKIDEILIAVLNMGPVVVGIDFYYGMQNCSGILASSGGVMGQHAMVVYGVDLKKNHFLAINSWGTEWGRLGTCTIDMDTMNKIFKYGFAIVKN